MTDGRLKALGEITDMSLDADLLALKQATARADDIAARIEALDAERRTQSDGLGDADFTAGAQYGRWLRWAYGERARLNTALATARADQEAKRARAERAFGRAEAVKSMSEQERIARRLTLARRRYDES